MSDLDPITANPGDLCFIDVETRSSVDVTVHGAFRHTAQARVTIVAYAIGEGEVKDWCVPSFDEDVILDWADAPADLREIVARVRSGTAWFVAHNAAFEMLAFSRAMRGMEDMRVEWFLDSMTQAMCSHLPADLAGAARAVGMTQKQSSGKSLIKMFADASREETPQSHPSEWQMFREYARDDVAAMRDIYFATMPLSKRAWAEYHAVERINHRGVPVDVEFVKRASELSAKLTETSNADILRLTGGKVRTVNQSAALLDWIRYSLRALPEVDRILTREVDLVEDEDGEARAVAKLSLGRSHVEELIAYLERLDEEQGLTDEEFDVLQVLEVRLYGASATPKKYKKIEALVEADGFVRGGYVFSGAAATGRMAGRGVQWQNLARATIGSAKDEAGAIELIAEKGVECFDELRERWGPVGRTLSRLIRPAVVAPEGYTLVWSDLSSIEARVLPWLTMSESGDALLEVFRQNDADPSLPDHYKVTAGGILRKDPRDVTKAERQAYGKIPSLSLQFGGGKGALFNMARAYGASFTDAEAAKIVADWRETNPWAVRYWDRIWEAVLWCMENPGEPREAGRVTYVYDAAYMQGTLFCVLPCGRPLLYPGLRWAEIEQKNKQTGEVTKRMSLTVRQARARVPLSHLTLTNNVTQGTAASLLREALVKVEREPLLHTILTTHDECVCMVREENAEEGAARLAAIMKEVPPWAEGLPISADSVSHRWYSKAVGD